MIKILTSIFLGMLLGSFLGVIILSLYEWVMGSFISYEITELHYRIILALFFIFLVSGFLYLTFVNI